MPFDLKKWASFIAIGMIAMMHLIGIIGLNSNQAALFERLTPLNLLFTFVIVLPFFEGERTKLLAFYALAFCLGMFFEILGVHTGFPFGSYYYTDVLSIQLFEVPLMIGINWFILSYGILSGMNQHLPNLHFVFKAGISALVMTFMDFLIEPFAIKHSLWVWANQEVPIANYLAWLLISFLLFLLGFKILSFEKNKVAYGVVVIFFIFFALNLLNV
jgi:uncharacterized membrane protein